jgi:hypothetical protein
LKPDKTAAYNLSPSYGGKGGNMLSKKTIATLITMSIFFAFSVPFAIAGGAGGSGDPIAWFFSLSGAFDDSGRGSRATGRVTSVKPEFIDSTAGRPIEFSCVGAYPTYLNITVELNRGRSTELFYFPNVGTIDGDPFCADDYGAQTETFKNLLADAVGGTIYWNSVSTVAWNDSEQPYWEIFTFSITIPY